MDTNQNGTVTAGEKHLVIKKYANRKFYDTENSCYITLGQIKEAALTRSIVVVDNVSKKDITNKTLLMALVETTEEASEITTEEIMGLIRKSKNEPLTPFFVNLPKSEGL
jgi:polyhydroxyalkanoate synthesis regulator protein